MNSNPFVDRTSGMSTPTIVEPNEAEVGSSSFSNRADAGSPLPSIESHSPEPPESRDDPFNLIYNAPNSTNETSSDFTVLHEPEVGETLKEISNALTFESSDSVSFQPCRQEGVNQDRCISEKWNYAQHDVELGSWQFAGVFDG